MKKAILQVADTGPLESLVVMLRSVGYECYLPTRELKDRLRRLGCDTVLDVDNLVRGWGYDRPMPLPEAGVEALDYYDLYVDVKAHRNGPLLWKYSPRLRNRTLWYRINGGQPEHVVKKDSVTGEVLVDHGDEVNPPCPVITPNQWYKNDGTVIPGCMIENGRWKLQEQSRAYAFWPPFVGFERYRGRELTILGGDREFSPIEPVCLLHNSGGWGYRDLISPLRSEVGLRVYGHGSHDGLVRHGTVLALLQRTLAMIHCKSNDAPGYALYEALASACPIILPRRLVWRCRMQDLFEDGVNCYMFDRETHDALSPDDVVDCLREIRGHLLTLSDPVQNRRIGEAGRERLLRLMWSEKNENDVRSMREFMERNFDAAT